MAKSKQAPPASGVYAALATPRRQNSTEADAAALLDYLDAVVRGGVDGVVLFGSTGEFVHFDIAERIRVLALAIRRSRVPVLVNVSHSTVAGAIDLAESAITQNVAGVLLMPPYFFRYTDAQLFAFYEQFLRAIGGKTRVYLYNIPAFTNPISPELASRLLETGAFAGVKDSSPDGALFATVKGVRAQTPVALLVGSESLYLESRLAGGDGTISGVAAALPELVVAIERAIRAQAIERARELNAKLAEFVSWVDRFPATAAIKQAAVARGWKLNHFPFSFDEDTQAELAAFHHWLHEWLPATLEECKEVEAAKA